MISHMANVSAGLPNLLYASPRKSFRIITLGCKVNQYESAYIHEALVSAGWGKKAKGEKADVSIINTCIVTKKASHQSRQEIRRAIRENPEGLVAVTGCYAQVYPDELKGINGINLIAGNTLKGKLPEILLNKIDSEQSHLELKEFDPNAPFEFLPIRHFPDRSRAFLKIQDGCESFCSYCIVPAARGPYRSLSSEIVLSMIESLAKENYREVVLTGIHLGKYGVDLEKGMNLNRLLLTIGREKIPVRIRLSSLEINEIDKELIEMTATEKWICKHFHIPLQSGDNGILKRMKRNYTVRQFIQLVEAIHEKIPLAAIGVDVMSGFPGEDAAAYQRTYALINDLPVSYLHVFPYSVRYGTEAATFDDQVDPGTIKKRALDLRNLGQKKRISFYRSCLKNEFMVLPEGWYSEKKKLMKGTSGNYLPVIFSLQKDTRRILPVFIERLEGNRVIGSSLNVCNG